MRSLESLILPEKKKKSQHNNKEYELGKTNVLSGARTTAWAESWQSPPRHLRGRCLLSPMASPSVVFTGKLLQPFSALGDPQAPRWWFPHQGGFCLGPCPTPTGILSRCSRLVPATQNQGGGFRRILGMRDPSCTAGADSENGPFSMGFFFLLTGSHPRKYSEKNGY